MKKLFAILLLTLTVACSVFAEDIVDSFAEMATKLVEVDSINSKPRYAFITLTSETEELKICEYITDALMEAVYSTGKIKIIERSKLDNILEELQLQSSGIIDEETAKEIGKVAGVDYICYGSFSEVEEQYFIKVKVTDVQTGELCALASDYILPDEYISELNLEKINKETETKKLAKEKEKNKRKEKNTYMDLYFTYDGFIPDITKYYGLTFGAEQRLNYITFGPSLSFYGPFSNSEQKNDSFFCGYFNLGTAISIFYFKVGVGYGLDLTGKKEDSMLVQGQVGINIYKIKIEYTAEELFATEDFRQKVSLGLLFKI